MDWIVFSNRILHPLTGASFKREGSTLKYEKIVLCSEEYSSETKAAEELNRITAQLIAMTAKKLKENGHD